MKNKNLTITGVLGMLAIILGAFGAHTLKEKLGVDDLKNFETAVRYQMYHVIVLLIVNMYSSFTNKVKNGISLFFFFGIVRCILLFQLHLSVFLIDRHNFFLHPLELLPMLLFSLSLLFFVDFLFFF